MKITVIHLGSRMHLPSLLSFIPKSCAENYCTCLATIFTSLLWVFSPEDAQFNKQTKTIPNDNDFIVVGAGSAGCVVANRLTENKEWNVILLEAGGEEPVAAEIPGFFNQLLKTEIDWNYTTEAEEGSCLLNEGCSLPRGRVMGGTSTLNHMIYIRGNKNDYNNWAKMGNPGWSYDEILPYFKKSENNKDSEIIKQNPGYHGTGGYLTVSKFPLLSPSGEIIHEAFNELGFPTRDVNAESQLGITNTQLTMDNGVRMSTNRAFIRPIRGTRPNLIVKNEIYVTKILIDPVSKKATGVEYKCRRTGITGILIAKKEVIVSAGVINSPKLLMVSGVGPADELERLGINVYQNLSVGHNLHDHLVISAISGIIKNVSSNNVDECKEKVENFSYYARTHEGSFSSMPLVFLSAFARTEYEINKEVPDIQLIVSVSDENKFYIFTTLLAPKSRGIIKLNATDPIWGSPLIHPGYLTAEPDLKRIIKGIRIGLSVFNTTIMKKYPFKLNDVPMPPCDQFQFNSDEYWICVVRQLGSACHHLVGTCKMGPKEDSQAVVDPRLRVHGIKGLRVIDASIMPVVTRGNPNTPTIMIAEKGSDMIKEDWLGLVMHIEPRSFRYRSESFEILQIFRAEIF